MNTYTKKGICIILTTLFILFLIFVDEVVIEVKVNPVHVKVNHTPIKVMAWNQLTQEPKKIKKDE